MEEESEADLLAEFPPHLWSRAKVRARAAAQYLELAEPTVEAAARFAGQLQVNVRTFYRLVAFYKAARSALRQPSRQGTASPLNAATAHILDDVVNELGPEATDAQILAESRSRCADQGLPPPSWSAVRTRTGKRPAKAHLAKRLNLTADLILDTCPLLLDVECEEQRHIARLTALIHVPTGRSLAHRLHTGLPTRYHLLEILKRALAAGVSGSAPARRRDLVLTASSQAAEAALSIGDILSESGIAISVSKNRLRSGRAVMAAFGLKLGRIPFAPLRRANGTEVPSRPLWEATEIIDRLIAQIDEAQHIDQPSFRRIIGARRSSMLQRLLEETEKLK